LLKFHQLILKKFFSLFLSLFIISGAIIYYWTKEFYIEQTKETLLQNIELISLDAQKYKSLDELASLVKKSVHLRLTIIDADGNILAESHKDKTTMDNHKNRDEIIQARKNTIGYKIRHSKTIDRDMLYVVKKFQNHKLGIFYIRLAKELKSIDIQIFSLGVKLFSVLIVFFIVVFFMMYKINTQLQNEIKKITTFLKALTKKDKPKYINSEYSQEFSTITQLLTKISQILIKKDKKKSKYTSELKRLNKQKDDIISAISHEFKNPIAVINGYSQTILDDEDLSPAMRKKFISKIYKNGTKLSSLIDTLRLSIKLESHKQDANFMKTNLYELVLDMVENIKLNYPNKEIKIDGSKEIYIKVDEILFGIVITNIVENALKYSDDEVYINFTKHYLEVVDTGIGIKEKDISKLADKFFRVSSNRWNNSLGLGLFLVKNILELHNFKLEIQSKENEGSTFRVVF
jgi:signal transduction histidine kinase